jgi:hypothetical protein
MTSQEKLEMLSDLLTSAAGDITVRDRCLASPESARGVVSELNPNVVLPDDFRIQFVPEHETAKTTNTLLLKIPPFFGQQNEVPRMEAEQYFICTYMFWLDELEPAPQAAREPAMA